MNKTSFPLRIHDEERARGKRLAEEMGISENRLYADLIHDGLLMREQMLYLDKLQQLASRTRRDDALAILARAPDGELVVTDRY